MSEYEHQEYPKMIEHPTEVDRVIKDGVKVMKQVMVKDADEEAEVLGTKKKVWPAKKD